MLPTMIYAHRKNKHSSWSPFEGNRYGPGRDVESYTIGVTDNEISFRMREVHGRNWPAGPPFSELHSLIIRLSKHEMRCLRDVLAMALEHAGEIPVEEHYAVEVDTARGGQTIPQLAIVYRDAVQMFCLKEGERHWLSLSTDYENRIEVAATDATLRFRALAPDGKPRSGVRVEVERCRWQSAPEFIAESTSTDENGEWVLKLTGEIYLGVPRRIVCRFVGLFGGESARCCIDLELGSPAPSAVPA